MGILGFKVLWAFDQDSYLYVHQYLEIHDYLPD